MRKPLLFLLLCGIFTFFSSCEPIAYDTFATVCGTIVDAETMEPISGVLVTLSPLVRESQVTKSDGYFEFHDLEAGIQYTIGAQKKGYNYEPRAVYAIGGKIHTLTITMMKQE